MASVSPRNSTNVRILRTAVRLAEQVAPAWLEEQAFRAWCRPQKRASRWGALAATARRFTFDAGEPLAAWEWNVGGPRDTALLVHGWSGNAGQMSRFVEPLVQRGYHVVAVDLPAHGESAGDFTTLVGMANAVVSLGRRLFPELIVAHSLGATATALALEQGLAPSRVALLAPPARMPPYLRHFTELVGLSEAMNARLLRRIEALVQRKMEDFELGHLAPQLGHVDALLVHDEGDDEVPASSSREVVARWPGARLVTMQGLGHHGVRRDAAVVAQVMDFVTEKASAMRAA
jgi:pimeloyl-ACP methyl ester carboxylesterase